MSNNKRFQFINWFPEWQGFGFGRWKGGMRLIYDWSLSLGFWEVRKWHKLKAGEIDKYNSDVKL